MQGNAVMPAQRNGHFHTMHTLHCNAAVVQLCMTHYRVAALLCGFMSSLHLVSPAQSFFTVLSHSKRRILYRTGPKAMPAPDRPFSEKLLTFEKIPVSAGPASPRNRPRRSSVPLSDKCLFHWTFVFCLVIAVECIGGFSKFFDWLFPEDDGLHEQTGWTKLRGSTLHNNPPPSVPFLQVQSALQSQLSFKKLVKDLRLW